MDDDLIHTLQLWLNLPASLENTKTFYQNIYVEDVPRVPSEGVATLTYNENGEGNNAGELVITAKKRSKILVYSSVPIKEKVVAYGPFVMNSMEEIREAYRNF